MDSGEVYCLVDVSGELERYNQDVLTEPEVYEDEEEDDTDEVSVVNWEVLRVQMTLDAYREFLKRDWTLEKIVESSALVADMLLGYIKPKDI